MFRTISITAALLASVSLANPLFDQNITPDAIFGSGNANGSFTTWTSQGVELGLRGKLRFDASNNPQNTFNSNGDGSYTFQAGTPPTGFGFAPGNPQTAIWNFEWSINTDVDDTTGTPSRVLGDLTYEIGIDADPSAGTNFLAFDPINSINVVNAGVQWDHSIGTNLTGNGGGIEVPNSFANPGDQALYASRIASNNVAQNSWNYLFFATLPPLSGFDPNDLGEYEIYLAAFDAGTEIARSTITINVVPAPATAMLAGVAGLAAVRRRR